MPKTVQAGKSPAGRVEVGDGILAAAKHADTAPVKGDLAEFRAVHVRYSAAEAAVRKAEAAKRKQEEVVGERDVEQDQAIAALGAQLTADGLPKGNPFAALSSKKPLPAASKIQSAGYKAEAAIIHDVAKSVRKHKGLSKRSLELANKADKAATDVESALVPMEKLEKAFTTAIKEREALSLPWETALSTLKQGARYADVKQHGKLFATLFQSAPQAASKPRGKKASETDKADKADKTDKTDKTDKADKTDNTGKAGKTDETGKAGKELESKKAQGGAGGPEPQGKPE